LNVDWKIEIGHPKPDVASDPKKETTDSLLHEIVSYEQPKDSNKIYGCGYYLVNSLETKKDEIVTRAAMVKIDEDGELQYLFTFNQNSITTKNSDKCRAVTFDERRNEIVLLIEAQT